jgi:hypothetical protein
VERELRGREDGSKVNNVQYKSNWNCHYESPLHNDYILIKIYNKNRDLMFRDVKKNS